MAKPTDKSFWNPNREFSEVISRLADAVEASKSVALLQLTWFKETQGAITKRDLEKGLKQLKDDILQELKGNMASLQEQLAAQKAQLTEITSNIDGVTDGVAALATSFTGISGDIAHLKQLVEKLQGSPGSITPEDQVTLDEMQGILNGLTPKTAKAKTDLDAVKTAAAELDAATEPGGSGDGGPTPPTP